MGTNNTPFSERRTGFDAPKNLLMRREMHQKAVVRYPRSKKVKCVHHFLSGVRCLIISPPKIQCRMLYFHGGGFRLGSPEIAAGFASHMATRSHCQVILPYYGLSPENPFPSSLLDGADVLEVLPKDAPSYIGGDSAGGNLAAVLARRFPDAIRGLVLFSPWLDLRNSNKSYVENKSKDNVFSFSMAEEASNMYLQGFSASHEDVSPILGDLSRMPDTFITVGSDEVLIDDARQFSTELIRARRSVSLHIIDRMSHVEPLLNPNSECTMRVLKAACTFIQSRSESSC